MIDKPTYSEALAHLATMWANEDAARQTGKPVIRVNPPTPRELP
jgi:hypothetical protein